MNLTGLHELLDERCARLPSTAEQRVAAVGLRVARLRRRRLVAVAVTVLAVLVAAGLPVAWGRDRAGPRPAVAGPSLASRLIDGFPEWAEGSRVVVTSDGELVVGRQLQVDVPGNALGHTYFSRCRPTSQNADVLLRWEWNGEPLTTGTCFGGASEARSVPADDPRGTGGVLTVTVVSVGTDVGSPSGQDATPSVDTSAAAASYGTLAIAVGVIVPFDEYPLPSRPTELVDLDSQQMRADLGLFEPTVYPLNPLSDPYGPFTFTATVGDQGWINLVAQTPGTVTVVIDDGQPSVESWWDYGARVAHLALAPGTHTVSLTPARFTGQWRAVIDKS